MQKDQEPISDPEIKNALINFVLDGTLSKEASEAFMRSNRLETIRQLGPAGLDIHTSDHAALRRYQILSKLATGQVASGPFDGKYFEGQAFIERPNKETAIPSLTEDQARAAKEMSDEALSILEAGIYTEE